MKTYLALGIMLFLIAPIVVTQSPLFLNVWVDRGCGGNYKVGEKIMVYFETNAYWTFQVTIWEKRPDGRRMRILDKALMSGCPCNYGYVLKEPLYGKRTIEVELYSYYPGLQISNTCEINVVSEMEKKGNIVVRARDQNGAPVSSVTVLLDGAEKGKTDASGSLFIQEIAKGQHAIEVLLGGMRDARAVYLAEGETKTVDFLFSLVNEGTISVLVTDSGGKPISESQILVDGTLLGTTDANGRLQASIAAGSHAVLARKSGKERGVQIQISGGQTGNLEIVIETTGKVGFSIKDNQGKPVGGAQIFVDNELSGISDMQGNGEAEIAEGSHSIRVTKEGYREFGTVSDMTPGSVLSITMIQETPYLLYGFIGLVIILLFTLLLILLLKKRRPVIHPVEKQPEKETKEGEAGFQQKTEGQPLQIRKFCSACGRENEATSVFCKGCGKPLM